MAYAAKGWLVETRQEAMKHGFNVQWEGDLINTPRRYAKRTRKRYVKTAKTHQGALKESRVVKTDLGTLFM